MTMATPPPTEEERRLLREYRLTTVPSRRSSCSPATSNASSSTTTTTAPTNNLTEQQLQQVPQITTATTPKETNSSQCSPSLRVGTNNNGTIDNNITPNSNSQHQHGHSQHNHHHHHKHHHGSHHHYHNGNHKKHKSTTPTHELTTDELNRMLELVSELTYLKLVSSKSITTTNGSEGANGNGSVINPKYPSELDNQLSRREVHTMTNGNGNGAMSNISTFTSNCINSTTISTNSCKPYIFEKVDYIKKISIRRKAFKKLKKARNKSRIISPPNITESPKIKL